MSCLLQQYSKMETLPSNIRNLPTYSVPSQLFICSTIAVILLGLSAIALTVVWIYRSCKHVHNYEYMAGHQFLVYYNKKQEQIRQDDPDANFLPSQKSDSRDSQYSLTTETQYKEFNRNQSRFLEFICLSVVLAININSYTCRIFELAAFLVAFVLFIVFNVLRKLEQKQFVRLLFFIPLIVAFLPFYIQKKALNVK